MSKLVLSVKSVVLGTYSLDLDVMIIGRKLSCDITLDDDAVSGEHFLITMVKSDYLENYKDAYIEDLGSTNGTKINEKPLKSKHHLKHHDRIKVGHHVFTFDTELGRDELERTAIYLPDTE
ncbi:hypothetical protein MNBD_GAMMA22-2800 [hydrothermal vent metagenome]|uniref:FHA domain-containing protein n=1 Tax=hydrothermal vent metagenome TaxID=652676 RepID=A0A3B0ZRB0_9ZZZZ